MKSPVRQFVFNVAVQSIGRAMLARDVAFGWAKIAWEVDPDAAGVSRHRIQSGRNHLDAILVQPIAEPAKAAVLICHGIGETVQRWHAVQQLLAANGVASLVFDYAGYGSSKGFFSAKQSERDAVAAFHFLAAKVSPLPVSLLGFSLGSGVAAAIVPRVPASGLLLCAAFTSIRDAARSLGMPRALLSGVPPIWKAEDALRASETPVLIVHGERDRLFPTRMAEQLSACCGASSRVILVPELGHSDPYHRPTAAYWRLIIDYLLSRGRADQPPPARASRKPKKA